MTIKMCSGTEKITASKQSMTKEYAITQQGNSFDEEIDWNYLLRSEGNSNNAWRDLSDEDKLPTFDSDD